MSVLVWVRSSDKKKVISYALVAVIAAATGYLAGASAHVWASDGLQACAEVLGCGASKGSIIEIDTCRGCFWKCEIEYWGGDSTLN